MTMHLRRYLMTKEGNSHEKVAKDFNNDINNILDVIDVSYCTKYM